MQLAARTSDPFLLSSPSASAGAERYSVGLTGGAAQWSFLRRDSRLQSAAARSPAWILTALKLTSSRPPGDEAA